MSATPAERRLKAQHAALTRWAKTPNRTAATAAARDGLLAKFEKQVDPNGEFTPEVRRKLAESARKAHLASMTRLAAAARSKARGE